MSLLRDKFQASPIAARFLPFAIFVALTALQGHFGKDSMYWMYALKTAVGAWVIWEMRPFVPEMRWAISLEACLVGIAVFVIWVGLDPFIPKNHLFFKPTASDTWNPFAQYGAGSALAWLYVTVRTLGSALIVPPIEEVFYRSFLYRYFVRTDLSIPLKTLHPTSFIVTALIFGLMHYEWLAGVLCGMAYQWLVVRKGRLGDAMAAHAITNFLLGVWVVWRGAWQFW